MMDIYKEIREKARERFQSAYAKNVSLTNKYGTKKNKPVFVDIR